MSGVFVAIVGPSGAGKDTLINFARTRLAERNDVVFVRRIVTRPADRASEDHDSLDAAAFERLHRSGGLALCWDAHELRYGLPIAIDADIDAGRAVVANVSRQTIGEIEARYQRVVVVAVSAHPDVIAARLAARGREDASGIERRLKRVASETSLGTNVVGIENSGPLSLAGERLVDVLQSALARSA